VSVERVQFTPDAVPGLTDDQLRADILRLEGDLKLPVRGSVARAKKFAAAKQSKAANSLGQATGMQELPNGEKVVSMLRKGVGNAKTPAAKQKKAANSSEDTKMAQELRNVEMEVRMLTKAVMKITPPKMQILRVAEINRVDGPPLELPVEAQPTDKAHCFHPDIWVRDQCRSDPRGNPVLAREYQRLCGGNDNAPACKDYKSRYVSA
jgi:hypothetical protein